MLKPHCSTQNMNLPHDLIPPHLEVPESWGYPLFSSTSNDGIFHEINQPFRVIPRFWKPSLAQNDWGLPLFLGEPPRPRHCSAAGNGDRAARSQRCRRPRSAWSSAGRRGSRWGSKELGGPATNRDTLADPKDARKSLEWRYKWLNSMYMPYTRFLFRPPSFKSICCVLLCAIWRFPEIGVTPKSSIESRFLSW